jgi:hypothetical protein
LIFDAIANIFVAIIEFFARSVGAFCLKKNGALGLFFLMFVFSYIVFFGFVLLIQCIYFFLQVKVHFNSIFQTKK